MAAPVSEEEQFHCQDWNLSIRTTLLPKETNHHGTIFGGVILSYIDIAGAIEAKRYCQQMVVTVAMKEVVFKQPVYLGDLISFHTRITRVGRTSITTQVKVIAARSETRHKVQVTEATVTYVTVDRDRNAVGIQVRDFAEDPPAFAPNVTAPR